MSSVIGEMTIENAIRREFIIPFFCDTQGLANCIFCLAHSLKHESF